MNAKPLAQRVRESEARKREKGLVAVKVWVPDTPEDRDAVRQFAAKLVEDRSGGGKDSAPSIGTPPAFRDLLVSIATDIEGDADSDQ